MTILGLNSGSTSNHAIDSGFTLEETVAHSFGQHYGLQLAYLIQGAGAAVNPQWSWTTGDFVAAAIASFKASAGPASDPRTDGLIVIRGND